MRAQWVCSREWRIALYKRSSINQTTRARGHTQTHTHARAPTPTHTLVGLVFERLIDWSLSWADSLRSHVVLHECRLAFYSAFFFFFFFNIHRSGVITALAWLVPHETAAISAQVLCTPYNHAPCHFMQSHVHKVYACLAVTCHLRFWQNDRDLLRATAVLMSYLSHGMCVTFLTWRWIPHWCLFRVLGNVCDLSDLMLDFPLMLYLC